MRSPERRVALALLMLGVVASSGCSTHWTNLVQTGRVSANVEPSRLHEISGIQILQGSGDMRIHGHIRRTSPPHSSVPGHVDIEIVQADGQILRRQSMQLHAEFGGRRGAAGLCFDAWVDLPVPAGSTIRIRHDRHTHQEATCEPRSQNVLQPREATCCRV